MESNRPEGAEEEDEDGSVLDEILDGVQLTTVGQILSYLLVSSLDGSTSTQPVDSNIFKSSGSPLRTPSMIVNEWQVAMPISNNGG